MAKKKIALGEFIQIYATTHGSGGLRGRPATRVKRLADAIYGQPEILDALREHPASGAAGIVTVRALRKEMEALELAGEIFGTYQVDHGQERTSRAGVDKENRPENNDKLEEYESVLGDTKFDQMHQQVNSRAPLLFELLNGLMAPKRERKDQPSRDPSKFNNRIAIITSILCYSRASKGSNKFPRMFGAFLHSNGVKQRVLDLLHQFGLCEGHKAVHKHLETVAKQAKVFSLYLGVDVN